MKTLLAITIIALSLSLTTTAQSQEKVELTVNGKTFEEACEDYRRAWLKWKAE